MQNGTGELEKVTECLYCNFSPPLPKGGGNSRKKQRNQSHCEGEIVEKLGSMTFRPRSS